MSVPQESRSDNQFMMPYGFDRMASVFFRRHQNFESLTLKLDLDNTSNLLMYIMLMALKISRGVYTW